MVLGHYISLTFFTKAAAVLLLGLWTDTGTAEARGVPDNVKLAAKAMYAASLMQPDIPKGGDALKMRKTGTGACKWMNKGPAAVNIFCEAWYRDFSQDISYFVYVDHKVMYIAFRGTDKSLTSNVSMNEDNADPIVKHGHRVHEGWWTAKNKVWKKLKPLIVKWGKGRKVIVTGQSMGGVMAAYLTRTMLANKDTKRMAIRLITFGAPRYTLSYNFFPKRKTFYVYTFENLYYRNNRWRTDPVVFSWERGLRSGSWAYRKADTKRPKDSRKRVWTAKCRSNATTANGAHSAKEYYNTAMSGTC